MSRVIQMVVKDDGHSIFILDFNQETAEMTFRNTYDPRQLHKEQVALVGQDIKTNLYHFNVQFLNKFIHENTLQ